MNIPSEVKMYKTRRALLFIASKMFKIEITTKLSYFTM